MAETTTNKESEQNSEAGDYAAGVFELVGNPVSRLLAIMRASVMKEMAKADFRTVWSKVLCVQPSARELYPALTATSQLAESARSLVMLNTSSKLFLRGFDDVQKILFPESLDQPWLPTREWLINRGVVVNLEHCEHFYGMPRRLSW